MRSGISTACLYPLETEKSLSTLLDMDFRLFEIFFNTYGELRPPYLKSLKELLDAFGACVRSVHPFTSGFESMLLFSDYERRFLDGMDFYRHYFDAANLLGAGILVLHGQRDYAKSKITEEEYFDRYARLYELGGQYGVLVAQENVSQFRSEDPGFIRRMRAYLKDMCSFVLDIKQAVRAGRDPFEMCGAMGERIVHVHVNDHNEKTDCLLPGQGVMDFQKLKKQLLGFGYTGDFIIEVYRDSFRELNSLLAAKKLAEELAG